MAQNGTVAFVTNLPDCDFSHVDIEATPEARYDFRTKDGRWGYGCEPHYQENKMHPDLGLGKGQRLVTEAERKRDAS